MAVDEVQGAREACAVGAWLDALPVLEALRDELGPEDLELLALAGSLTGHYDAGHDGWERAHHAWVSAGNVPRAVRAAFWLGMSLVRGGQMARGGGWLGRAGRLLEEAGIECAETGRLQLPAGMQLLDTDAAAALEVFERACRQAVEYGDTEVATMARLGSGQALVQLGEVKRGIALLDEAMVGATTGDVSPVAVGIVYCAVIQECHRIFDVRRAREWTAELDRWSAPQQGLVPFRGQCLVHRSEVAQMGGDWDGAIAEAISACKHFEDAHGDPALGMALYQRGELHRLRGEYDAAERAYREGAALGRHDAPGRQLVLLGRGRPDEAAASIRRALDEVHGPVQRARILAAHVEIMVAVDDLGEARVAADDLDAMATSFGTPMLAALAARAAGLVALADRRAGDALQAFERSRGTWQALAIPYEVARTDALVASACRLSGDVERAADATRRAREVFEQLGAGPDLEQLDGEEAPAQRTANAPGGLSSREVEVLGLVAKGLTNRQVAEALVISEKTVARHVSNIFTKLGVGTRSAATAWAFQNGLVLS